MVMTPRGFLEQGREWRRGNSSRAPRPVSGRIPAGLSALFIAAVSIAGCDDTDVISLRLALADDGSGTVTVNSVQVPEAPGPVERGTSGATWSQRVNLVAASGSFEDLSSLRVEDIAFERGHSGENAGYVQVTLPLGAEAQWPDLLVAAESDQLDAASATVDPTGKVKLGKAFKIVLALPGRVVAQGTRPETRQAKMKIIDAVPADGDDPDAHENRVATLVVPLGMVRAATGTLTWHVIWSR